MQRLVAKEAIHFPSLYCGRLPADVRGDAAKTYSVQLAVETDRKAINKQVDKQANGAANPEY